MRVDVPEHLRLNPLDWLRRQGYAVHHGGDGQTSYVRRAGGDVYPRYHCYVKRIGERLAFDLHLDQKQPSYDGSSAHAGEYDGPLVAAEVARLRLALDRG